MSDLVEERRQRLHRELDQKFAEPGSDTGKGRADVDPVMKRNLVVALMLVALSLLTVTTSFAQDKAKYDVPFAFQVGKASLPAGIYTVSKIADHSIVIRNRQHTGQAALMNYGDRESKLQSPKLVFRKRGQRYFLAEASAAERVCSFLNPSGRRNNAGNQRAATDSAIVIFAMT